MTDWTERELDTVAAEDEVEVTSPKSDGTLRKPRTIWAVRVDDGVYIRAAYGPDTAWYRHAVASGSGRLSAGSLERDVTYTAADDAVEQAVDAAYTAKYHARYPQITPGIVGEKVHGLTLRVDPA